MVGPVRERRVEEETIPQAPVNQLPRVLQGDLAQTIIRFNDLDRAIRSELDGFTSVVRANCLDPTDIRSSFRETLRRLETIPLIARRFDSIRENLQSLIDDASQTPNDRANLIQISQAVQNLSRVIRFESGFLLRPTPRDISDADSFAYFASLEGAIFDQSGRARNVLRAAAVYDTLSALDTFSYCPRPASSTRTDAFRFVLSHASDRPYTAAQLTSDNDFLSGLEAACSRAANHVLTTTRAQILAVPAILSSANFAASASQGAFDSMRQTFSTLQGEFNEAVSDLASTLSYVSRFQSFLASVHQQLYPDLSPSEFSSALMGTSREAIYVRRSIDSLLSTHPTSTQVGSVNWFATNASRFLSSGNLQVAALCATVATLLSEGVSIPQDVLSRIRDIASGSESSQSDLSSLRLSIDRLYADHILSPIERSIRRSPNFANRQLLVSADSAVREAINRGNPSFAYSLLPAVSDLFSLSRRGPFVGSNLLTAAINSALLGDMDQFNSLYGDFVSVRFAINSMDEAVSRSSRTLPAVDSSYLSRIVRSISDSLNSSDPLVRDQGFAAYSALSPVLDYLQFAQEFSVSPRSLRPFLVKVWDISQSSSPTTRSRLLSELAADLNRSTSSIVSATSQSIRSRIRDPSHSSAISTLMTRIESLTSSDDSNTAQLGFTLLNLTLILSRNYSSLTRGEKDQCLHSLLTLSDANPTDSSFQSTYRDATSTIRTILTRALNRTQVSSQSQTMLAALDGRARFSPNLSNGTIPLANGTISISELREAESPLTISPPPNSPLNSMFGESDRTRIINPPRFAVSFESLGQSYQRAAQSGRSEDLQSANALFSTFVEERLAERQRRAALSTLGGVSSALATSYISLRQNFTTILQTFNIAFDERVLNSLSIQAFVDSLPAASRARIPVQVLNAYLHLEQELESLNSRALTLLASPDVSSTDQARRSAFFTQISDLRTQSLAHLENSATLRSITSGFCLNTSRRNSVAGYIRLLTVRSGDMVQTPLMNLRIASREFDGANSALLRAFDLFASGAPADQIRSQKDQALASYSEGISRISSAMASYMVRYPEDDGRSFYIPIPDYEPGPYRPGPQGGGPGGSGPFNPGVPTGTEVVNLTGTYFGTWNSQNSSLMRTALFGSSAVPRTQSELDSATRNQRDQMHALNAIELAIFGLDPYRWTQAFNGPTFTSGSIVWTSGGNPTRSYGITQRDLLRDLRDGNYRFAQQFATELVARARENEQTVQTVSSLSLFALGFVPIVGLPLSILGGGAMLYENAAMEYRANGSLSPTTVGFIGAFALASLFGGAVGVLGRMRTSGISAFNALSTPMEQFAMLPSLSRLEQAYVASGYGLFGSMALGSGLGIYATATESGQSEFSSRANLFMALFPLAVGVRPAIGFMRATRVNPFSQLLGSIAAPIPVNPAEFVPGTSLTIPTTSQTATPRQGSSRGIPIRVNEGTPIILTPAANDNATPVVANDNASTTQITPTSIFQMLQSMQGASLAELRAIRDSNPTLYNLLSSLRRDPNISRALRNGTMDQNALAIIASGLESSGLAPSERAIAASGETPTPQRVDAQGRLVPIQIQEGATVASANGTSGTPPTPNAPAPNQAPQTQGQQPPTRPGVRQRVGAAWDALRGTTQTPRPDPLPATSTEANGIVNTELSGIFDSLLRRVRLGGDQVLSDVSSLILECDRLSRAQGVPSEKQTQYRNLRNELYYALETNPEFATAMRNENNPLFALGGELRTLAGGRTRNPNFAQINANLLVDAFSQVATSENITGQSPYTQRFNSLFGVSLSPSAQGALIALGRIPGCEPVQMHGNYLTEASASVSGASVPSGFEAVRVQMNERILGWRIQTPENAYPNATALFDAALGESATSRSVADTLFARISTTRDNPAIRAANRSLCDSFAARLGSGNVFDALASILPDGEFKTQFQGYSDLFRSGRFSEIQGVVSEAFANNPQNPTLAARLQFISDFLTARMNLTSESISTPLNLAEPLRRVVRETNTAVETQVQTTADVNAAQRFQSPVTLSGVRRVGARVASALGGALEYLPPVSAISGPVRTAAARRARTTRGVVQTPAGEVPLTADAQTRWTSAERRGIVRGLYGIAGTYVLWQLYQFYSSRSTADADTTADVSRMLGAQLTPENMRLVRQTTGVVTPQAVPVERRTSDQRDIVTNGLLFLSGQYVSIPQNRLLATNQSEVITCMSANNSATSLYPNPYTMSSSTNAFVAFLGRVQNYSRSGVRGGTGLEPLLHDLDTVNLGSPTSDQFRRIRAMIGPNTTDQTVIEFVNAAREIKRRSGTLDSAALYTLFTSAVMVPNGWVLTERQLSIYTFLHRCGLDHAAISPHILSLSNNPLFFASILEHVRSGEIPISVVPQLLNDTGISHAVSPRAPGTSDAQYYDAASAYYLNQFRSRNFVSPLSIRRDSLLESIDELQARHPREYGTIFQDLLQERIRLYNDSATPVAQKDQIAQQLNNLNLFEIRTTEQIAGDSLTVRFLATLVMDPTASFAQIQTALGDSVGRRGSELESLYNQLHVSDPAQNSIAQILDRARSIGLILPREIVQMYPQLINRGSRAATNYPTNAQMAQFLAAHTNGNDGLIPWLIRNREHLPNVPAFINAIMASSVRGTGSNATFNSGPIGGVSPADSSRLFSSTNPDSAQSNTNPRGLDSFVVSNDLSSRRPPLWSGAYPVLSGPRQVVTQTTTASSQIQGVVNDNSSPRSLPSTVSVPTISTSITPVATQAQNQTSIDLRLFTPEESSSITQQNLPYRILLNRESFDSDVRSLPPVLLELVTRAMVPTSDNGGDWTTASASLAAPDRAALNRVFASILGDVQQYYLEYAKRNHGQSAAIERRLANLGISLTREAADSPTVRISFDVVGSDRPAPTDFNLYVRTQYWADYVRDNAHAVERR